MWGRSLYENIQRFIVFQLTINVVAMGTALLGPFIGIKLPLTVIQMLWINLIMDTFAALALATEEPHSNVMDRKPRNPLDFILTKSMLVNVLVVGTSFLVFLIGFLLYIQHDDRVTELELSIFFTTFVMLQFWNLFNKRAMGRNESALKGIWANKGFLLIIIVIFIGQVLIVQFGGELFRLVPLSFNQWLYIICGTSIVLWFEEVKRFFNRRAFKIGVQ
jgi:Ca2+-transporting ATPase